MVNFIKIYRIFQMEIINYFLKHEIYIIKINNFEKIKKVIYIKKYLI